jgi:hypothetical protein
LTSPHTVQGFQCQVVFALSVLVEDGLKPAHVDLCVHVVRSRGAPMPAPVDVVDVDGKERVWTPAWLSSIRGTYRHTNRSPKTKRDIETELTKADVDVPRVD